MGYKMNKIKKYILVLALLSQSAQAQESTWMFGGLSSEPSKIAVGVPVSFLSTDSEGFEAYKVGAQLLPLYQHGDNYSGISYQFNKYTQNGWAKEGNQLGLTSKVINPRTALGYIANVNVNSLGGHTLLTTDSYIGFQPTSSTRTEFILSREWVETQNALNNGIYYTLGAASIEQRLLDRLSGIVMGGNMYFSDTNTRPFFRLNLIYDALPDYGVNLQLRYRQYRDTNTNVANNYFNPNQYRETMLAVGFRKLIEGWRISGVAGLGSQTINSDGSTGTQLLEFAATSPSVASVFFRTRIGYRKAAGFQGPDYTYSYFMEELIIPF